MNYFIVVKERRKISHATILKEAFYSKKKKNHYAEFIKKSRLCQHKKSPTSKWGGVTKKIMTKTYSPTQH